MRGVIRNREFAQQIRDFSGLQFGKITPTDLDAYIDFGNRLFVFVEGKHGEAHMPRGQELAFERLVDACHKEPERYSVGFVVQHETQGYIDFAKSVVRRYRWKNKWHQPRTAGQTLRAGIEAFRGALLKEAA